MDEQRRILFLQIGEHLAQRIHIMAVHRADVLESHFLEHGGVVNSLPDGLFTGLQQLHHIAAHHRDALQHRFHVGFHMEIFGVGTQLGQIPSHRTHVFGDGHFVVIENHNKIVEGADVVHSLIHHAAGKRAVAHNDHHAARLPFDFFCSGDADGRGQRTAAVSCHKSVAGAFLRAGETGNAVLFAQFRETFPAPRQQLMGIALVTDVKKQFVLRQIQRTVQCHRQFHNAKVGGKMAAGRGNALNQKFSYFFAQGRQLRFRQLFHIPRCMERIQQRITHGQYLTESVCTGTALRNGHHIAQQNAQRGAGDHLDGGVPHHFL